MTNEERKQHKQESSLEARIMAAVKEALEKDFDQLVDDLRKLLKRYA